MPSRRPKKATVPAQPTPAPKPRPARRHRRRNTRAPSSSASSSASASASASHPASSRRSTGRKRPLVTLTDLPEDVLHIIFLYVIDAPDQSPTLRYKSLNNWEYAIWIGRAHSKLYRVLKKTIRSVCIHASDTATPDEIALTTSSLRHLMLESHSLASQYLHIFDSLPVAALQSLHLENVDVPLEPFVRLVNSTRRLSSLTLSFVALSDVPRAFAATKECMRSLQTLRLHGLSGLTGQSLVSVCCASAHTLRTLSLRYLRHNSITDDVLIKQIGPACSLLTAIDLEHLSHVSSGALVSFCKRLAPQLWQLRLADVPLSQRQVQDVLAHADVVLDLAFANLSVVDPELLSHFLSTQRASGVRLERLDMRGVYALSDIDVGSILGSPAGRVLRSLTLRNCPLVGDGTCATMGGLLRVLDLRGCVVSDTGLRAIARRCKHLTDVALGSDGTQIPWHDAPLYRAAAPTNCGFDALLQTCGQFLRYFFWETPRAVVPGDGPIRFELLGAKQLHAGRLAVALAQHCQALVRVEVNWLRPAASNVAERAACDLQFFELDKKHRQVSVFLDKEAL